MTPNDSPLARPPFVVACESHLEWRAVTLFLTLLRRSKAGAMIVALKESGLVRFWANGQPAGALKE